MRIIELIIEWIVSLFSRQQVEPIGDTLTLPHPEELPDYTRTLDNVNLRRILVVGQFQSDKIGLIVKT